MFPRAIGMTCLAACLFSACLQEDARLPLLMPVADPSVHYRNAPYSDAGCEVADDQTCLYAEDIQIANTVDITRYGSYSVTYTAVDAAGNTGTAIRPVDIVLPLTDYYYQWYEAYDTCTSGNYFYTGLIQDCDCGTFSVIAGNISGLGLSASFTLPVSGQYNHILTMDTVKAAVHFSGSGIMNPSADTLFWNYSISDSVQTDVCRAVWIRE